MLAMIVVGWVYTTIGMSSDLMEAAALFWPVTRISAVPAAVAVKLKEALVLVPELTVKVG